MKEERRRFGAFVIGGLVGLAVISLVIVAARSRPMNPQPAVASDDGDAVWPYCFPDATPPPPSQTPWPAIPLGFEDAQPAFEPIGESIVVVNSVEIGVGVEGSITPDRVLWLSKRWPDRLPMVPGISADVLASNSTVLASIQGVLGEGIVVAGLSAPGPGEDVAFVEYVAVVDGPSIVLIGSAPLAERYSMILDTFLESPQNPESGRNGLDVLAEWSLEASMGEIDPATTPLRNGWHAFVAEEVLQRTDQPHVGSDQYWRAAPARCRDIADAPAGVEEKLTPIDVWFAIPEQWRGLSDGVICLNSRIASLGCTTLDSFGAFGYVNLDEPLAEPGGSIQVMIARNTSNGPSWLDRIEIGQISWSDLGTEHAVLVELDPQAAPQSFDSLALGSPADLVTIKSLSMTDVQALLEEASRFAPPPIELG